MFASPMKLCLEKKEVRMRKPNYFGTNLSKLRLNGFLMAGLLGASSSLNAAPANPTPPRKRENTLTEAKKESKTKDPSSINKEQKESAK